MHSSKASETCAPELDRQQAKIFAPDGERLPKSIIVFQAFLAACLYLRKDVK